VWERKYETDSLIYPLWLVNGYLRATRNYAVFDGGFYETLDVVLKVLTTEQRHENSPYTFERDVPTDTLLRGGRGRECAYTGMTWCGFRPSDDRCEYGYLIPSNLFAVAVLRELAGHLDGAENAQTDKSAAAANLNNTRSSKSSENANLNNAQTDKSSAKINAEYAARSRRLADAIERGVRQYGTVESAEFGKIYAYETDGFGNYTLMDDANVPSLLSLPYLGYCGADDPIYQNTRRFVLSKSNPYYFEGNFAGGVGSPHTPDRYIWHIGLIMQALTSSDNAEIARIFRQLMRTTAGTGYMHEGFHCDDPSAYTREWFAWANTLFAVLVMRHLGDADVLPAADVSAQGKDERGAIAE
jgi:meiotically up-regulated gene 157 (Mug157) protein